MSLFSPKSIRKRTEEAPPPDEAANPFPESVEGDTAMIVGSKGVMLRKLLPELERDHHYHVPSLGNWSMHDLLLHIIRLVGPAHVYMTSWAISEEPVRRILATIQRQDILSIHCLFDKRVKLHSPAAYQLAAANFVDMRVTSCHAKVMVIENNDWLVSVIGSANFTNNPRIECSVICTHSKPSIFHKAWILQEIENSKPFLDGTEGH